jgi:hypothetical protein
MNLLRDDGYQSAHAGRQALSHDIKGMLDYCYPWVWTT